MKYRKKPVVIEAFQYNGHSMNSRNEVYVPNWLVSAFENDIVFYASVADGEPCDLFIKTLEGNMLVNIGDYIIQGVKGELYPCKPDVFEMTYELVL